MTCVNLLQCGLNWSQPNSHGGELDESAESSAKISGSSG